MQRLWAPSTWHLSTRETVVVLAQLAACVLCVIVRPGSVASIPVSILWALSVVALIIGCFRKRWLKFFVMISALVAYRPVLDAALAWSCLVGGGIRACP